MKIRHVMIVMFLFLASNVAFARECSRGDEDRATEAVFQIHDWASLYSTFREYGHCDDGSIAEAFDGIVVHYLGTRWIGFFSQEAVWSSDRRFRRFLLNHLSPLEPESELNAVIVEATSRCPKAENRFCRKVIDTAKRAAAESRQADMPPNQPMQRTVQQRRSAPLSPGR